MSYESHHSIARITVIEAPLIEGPGPCTKTRWDGPIPDLQLGLRATLEKTNNNFSCQNINVENN